MSGVVAAGHEKTAAAAQVILQAGGNAFDAAVAAVFTACVAESMLTSLGGGGFLLAHTADGSSRLYDFFSQTPRSRPPSFSPSKAAEGWQPDFYPVDVNFGDTVQVFHVGLASMAVPGVFAGLLRVHQQLGRMPLTQVVEPAIVCAREGVEVNGFQGYVYGLLRPILMATEGARSLYAPKNQPLQAGDWLYMPEFAQILEDWAQIGHEKALQAFYQGDIAQQIVRDCQQRGGYLGLEDFQHYQVIERSPLQVNYRGVQMLTNPPPSAGGALIAFSLELLDRFDLDAMRFGSAEHLKLLSQVMRWTNEARRSHLDEALFDPAIAERFTAPDLVETYLEPLQQLMAQGCNRWGSTTHISVIDGEGNAASVTTSNGEGSAYVIPGTQIMINNMLGEEDLNPQGFHQWPLNQRLSSMMAPTLILQGGKPKLALGSGGSNRIRTAILQVISNIVDFQMPLVDAVQAPRIHWEAGLFHLEPGLALEKSAAEPSALGTREIVRWHQANMFFGGVHAVGRNGEGSLQGAGDPRRSGVVGAAYGSGEIV